MPIPSKRSSVPDISYKMKHDNIMPTPTTDKLLLLQSQPTTIMDLEQEQLKMEKRQQSDSVVHVTVTEAGTVIYTRTATSYSYVPTFSTILGPGYGNSSSSNGNNSSNSSSSASSSTSSTNVGAIVGGIVGGIAFIALIAFGYFLIRKRKRTKQTLQLQQEGYIDDDNGSYLHGGVKAGHIGSTTGGGMTSSNMVPAPRHLVAPMATELLGGVGGGTEREGDGRDSKYFSHEVVNDGLYYDVPNGGGYVPKTAYYNSNSVTGSDSIPSTTVDSNTGYISPIYGRHVPNEVDSNDLYYHGASPSPTIPAEIETRHVPHLKEEEANIQEPPHTKD